MGVTRRISALIVISGLLRAFNVYDTVPAAALAFERMQTLQSRAAA